MGLIDTSANISIIDESVAKENNQTIIPSVGTLNNAFKGQTISRIGQVENMEVRVGEYQINSNLEVAQLYSETKFIISMNLFNKLGITLRNLPFNWPTQKDQSPTTTNNKQETVVNINSQENKIPEEQKKVLEDNINLPPSSVCKLSNSVLSINTGDSKPSWIRQYPIPQALMEKVKERIELWKVNKQITNTPKNCLWNLPILAAAKPGKEKGDKDDIRLCLDARFLNDRIVEMPDSKLPLLRNILDRLRKF